ncbi:MAG: hypothetical protein PHG97_00625, partial [Candidatus Margulisbacteria bacterium]|nr:hypothetical protein [Candidatus Margulisiibacteriota bacterium]
MNWLKAIGFGIALFAIIFVVGSIAMFGLKLAGIVLSLTMLIAVIIVVYLLAAQYKIRGLNAGLQVGLVWLVIYALLEYIVVVQIFNKGETGGFYNWSVLLGYLLVVVIPA